MILLYRVLFHDFICFAYVFDRRHYFIVFLLSRLYIYIHTYIYLRGRTCAALPFSIWNKILFIYLLFVLNSSLFILYYDTMIVLKLLCPR